MTDLSTIRFSRRLCGDVTLHVAEAGPEDGPLVVLLHGFPEFWFGWRHQIGALAAAGYRVVAPDQRGYNLSDKPRGIARYDVDRLAADVVALAAHYTSEPFNLVGHDWGAVAAWWTASRTPQKIRRLAVLNCPHPAVWRGAMDNDPVQRKASWYVRAFRLPWLPEALMRSGNFRALLTALRQSKRPLGDDDAERYRAAWRQPGALTAMINWYRAILRHKFEPIAPASIRVPVQIIWGRNDPYALPALAEASKALCAEAQLTYLPDATHWVAHDAPERVNAILLDFLGR
ncbi:MAG TPA: alpha/beta hydrolase [Rhizomicrobium sp.]|jgi:pimeloyl-ACP methyl ester carboxylesterase|nr:alpha/beta hydrolase [Rhizomicrobium sp.]